MDLIACCIYKLSPKITGKHQYHRFNIFPDKERNGITGYLQYSEGWTLSHTGHTQELTIT
ncbi:hypothetical protein C5167_002810 [Papaver somniferum]|uniref:Uncharacterized protein n=1 Tax=Papaver somniferum TaxID=3469 RepID=A0A4Y7L1S8_PAPSO|nr:hypothetical protein C5167_002810 [Papaver somniferum]